MLPSVLFMVAPFALGAFAQSSSSSGSLSLFPSASMSANNSAPAATTLDLFLDAQPDQRWVGSIVAADACETTIALYCTAGDLVLSSLSYSYACDGQTAETYTYRGSTEFGYSTAVQSDAYGYDAEALATETCSLEPTSRAVCSVKVKASVEDNGKTKTVVTSTFEGAAATDRWFQVPITGGAEKLPAATATCTANGNAAAATGLSDLYKVVVVPGAAALLAGAAAL